MIEVSSPVITRAEVDAVTDAMLSGALAQGQRVRDFESAVCDTIGTSSAVACSSGTAALELALAGAGVGAGHEVIVPAFTFIATAAAVVRIGARPVFADVDPTTGLIDPASVASEVTASTRAVVPVHLYGAVADVKAIAAAVPERCHVIEDAAQAFGASGPEGTVGARGTAIFSFYPTKIITTGEGGLIATDNDVLATETRLLRNHGIDDAPYDYIRLGTNLRMTDIAAALGLAQLQRLFAFLARRQAIAERYLSALEQVDLPPSPNGRVWSCFTIQTDRRDALMHHLSGAEISSRVYYPAALSDLAVFGSPAGCPNATRMATRVLSLPMHPRLGDEDVDHVIQTVNGFRW